MTLSLIGMSLFEDKGKPKNSVMKMITVNYQQNERYLKNGRTRIRNAFKEEMHASNEFASFQSTPKTEIPSIPANNTVQITLKVNCKENIVTIENQNFDGTKNTAPTQKSLNEEISIKRNYVLAEHVDDDPPIPQKTVKSNSRRGKYSLKSATPNPNIRYYTKDEVSHALATDY
uniref:Uncharacterized protein n=1 Tax=Panagrolaimus superbus TaxID=310955 RepID=A0A914Y5S5_9BILA